MRHSVAQTVQAQSAMRREEEEEEEEVVVELKGYLEDENLSPGHKMALLNDGLNRALTSAAVHSHRGRLAAVRSRLYRSGILSRCAGFLTQWDRRGAPSQADWAAAATVAQLLSSCCVGLEAGDQSEAFHQLFLPSVVDGLLSLASRLMRQAECASLFRKLMDSVGWLLRSHTRLTAQVLSSIHYEHIQTSEDAAVSLLCVQLWTQACSSSSGFVLALSDDSLHLLLNEAVSQLAVSADSGVGGASVRLILLMADQAELRVHGLLQSFRGLDSLLDKDWRGRGFDQDLDQLIKFIQSDRRCWSPSKASAAQVRAACVIQAAWRSYQTRRRVKSLSRAVSTLQRRYRARKKQQQQQREAKKWEEELKYQVCLRRQQARREFHQKQRELLQLLPPHQVQSYLQECERRAAVLIQSGWRGFRERRRYRDTLRQALRETHTQQRAARTLQRAVRRFLQKRRAARTRPVGHFWIGQKGLTDSRRAELKEQVDKYISLHRSTRVSSEECERLHEEVQLLLLSELQKGDTQRRQEERMEAVLAHTRTQLELLREAPPLSVVTATEADSFLSPSAAVAARARDAHNAALQADRLPWWRTLGAAPAVAMPDSAHQPGPEAELDGLFVGGVTKDPEVDPLDL